LGTWRDRGVCHFAQGTGRFAAAVAAFGGFAFLGFGVAGARVLLLGRRAMGRAQEASISFDSVRDKNVMQLRKLNTAIFPVTYQDKFYTDALNSGDFTKLGTISLPVLFSFFHARVCV